MRSAACSHLRKGFSLDKEGLWIWQDGQDAKRTHRDAGHTPNLSNERPLSDLLLRAAGSCLWLVGALPAHAEVCPAPKSLPAARPTSLKPQSRATVPPSHAAPQRRVILVQHALCHFHVPTSVSDTPVHSWRAGTVSCPSGVLRHRPGSGNLVRV